MDKDLGPIFLLVLLLCPRSSTDSLTSCPSKCHCFTPVQVLCTDGGIPYLPRNMSRKVRELIVMSSDLQYLFSHTLVESPQLNKLIFINNALKSVHPQAFEHLTELRELEISGNPLLENLFAETFANQRNLTKLLLNFNSLATMHLGAFDSLGQLETLQMKGNVMTRLTAPLFLNLQRLRLLDLSQNKIAGVEGDTFAGLAGLEILKVNYNLIGNLTSDAFRHVPRLTELHLEGNKISELADGVFSAQTELEVLNLRGNLLATFSGQVFGHEDSSLRELNLKGNRLSEVSSLSGLTSLSSLVLSSNRLAILPEDVFRNNTALEYLDLSENRLASLPERIFHNLLLVEAIHLNGNNLSALHAGLFEDQAFLQRLHLADNALETLPRGLLDAVPAGHAVGLHGNPWRCDCRLWYLHDWVLRSGPAVGTLDRMLCASPAFLRRRPVAAVVRDQLVCRRSGDEEATPTKPRHRCSQEARGGTVIVRCVVDGHSPLTVRVQFQGEDGSVREHVVESEAENSDRGTGPGVEGHGTDQQVIQ